MSAPHRYSNHYLWWPILFLRLVLSSAERRIEHVFEVVPGRQRALVVVTPDSPAPARGWPLLLFLHGSTQDRGDSGAVIDVLLYPARRFERNYDAAVVRTYRQQLGFVTAYLAAERHGGWYCWGGRGEEYGLCSSQDAADGSSADVASVRMAIGGEIAAAMDGAGSLDPGATFVLGMSGGGFVTWRLLCDASFVGALRGAAVVASALAPSLRSGTCAENVSVAIFHGTADSFVDVAWAEASVAWFAQAHTCEQGGGEETVGPGVVRQSLAPCSGGRRLEYWRLEGAGHVFPGAPLIWEGLGPTSSFDALGSALALWGMSDGSDSSRARRDEPLLWKIRLAQLTVLGLLLVALAAIW